MNYAAEVFRFGGRNPRIDQGGRLTNLNHSVSFGPENMITDGVGHVIDHPLLPRKPCFGRPEAYLRYAVHDRKFREDGVGAKLSVKNQCDRCPVILACEKLSLERLESCQLVEGAYQNFDLLSDAVSHTPFLNSRTVRAWAHFLHALKGHGGWSSVNDARVSAAEITKKAERDAARRRSARKDRKKQAASRRGAPPPSLASQGFLSAVDSEFDRRLATLLDLNKMPTSPRWIIKLCDAGCTRTAEVWRAREVLIRTGQPIFAASDARCAAS